MVRPQWCQSIPDLPYLHRELKKKGVTLQLLFEEYRANDPDGYGRSQFFQIYRDFAKTLDPVMRIDHKAGETLFVDFAGDKPSYIEKGNSILAELFVAVLGASSYTFAYAVPDQTVQSWIKSHIRAFEFIGGLPEKIVPDNLKSGVTHPSFYDPELNPVYQEMAIHYRLAVIPARVKTPTDKAKVENGVLQAERRILAKLRNRTFFGIGEINDAIREELTALNDRPMQAIGKSRRELFDEIDKPALRPLPEKRFELCTWKKAKVHIDYHIAVEGSYYSAPYTLIREEVEVRSTDTLIEIFHKGKRVASHPRTDKKGAYITVHAHRPHSHQKYLEWTPERMREWGAKVGEHTAVMMEKIMASKQHPEHGFRPCLGLLRLAKTYGSDRLEKACNICLEIGAANYKSVKSLLTHHLEASTVFDGVTLPPLDHSNIRGNAYYGGEG